jgi:hypothetical protein
MRVLGNEPTFYIDGTGVARPHAATQHPASGKMLIQSKQYGDVSQCAAAVIAELPACLRKTTIVTCRG